jgi:hypothetical protein
VMAGVLCVALGPPWPASALVVVLGAAALAAWTGWRSGRLVEAGRLRVDAAGRASWLAASAGANPGRSLDDPRRASPIEPWQWQLGADEVWVLARDAHGARLALRMGRPDCDEHQWRALRRWLVWLGRSGPERART